MKLTEELTSRELIFYIRFLENNDCGACTPQELLQDNFSCQTHENLREIFGYSNNVIGGLISSLTVKGFLYTEERDQDPDLIWADDDMLEQLDDVKFRDLKD